VCPSYLGCYNHPVMQTFFKTKYSWLLVGWLLACLGFIWAGISKPLLGWQTVDWMIARSMALQGFSAVDNFQHQPLYTGAMALSFSIFGVSEAAARYVGLVSYLLILVFIFLITQKIADPKHKFSSAIAACLFFSISPLAIQGALVTDRADTTVFALTVVMFFYVLLKTEGWRFLPRVLLLGAVYGLCFSAKMTSALACGIAVFLAHLLGGEFKKGIKLALGVSIVGVVFFLGAWLAFCYLTIGLHRFFEPFAYYGSEAKIAFGHAGEAKTLRHFIDAFSVLMWFSPLFAALSLAMGIKGLSLWVRQKVVSSMGERYLAAFAIVIVGGYMMTVPLFNSFPKYVAPALPILCCLLGTYICRKVALSIDRKMIYALVLLFLVGVVYYYIFVGDWIYSLWLLRGSVLDGHSVIRDILYQQARYLLFPLAAAVLLVRLFPKAAGRVVLAVGISFLASSFALACLQSKADYAVNYSYGARGQEELKVFFQQHPALKVFASRQMFVAGDSEKRFSILPQAAWNDPVKLADFLAKNLPECIVYGLPGNTVYQMKVSLAAQDVQTILREKYQHYQIGSYHVVVRK
jgi:hypothetical protein